MPGVKQWANLEVLEAADLNDFLMSQAVPRFASGAARSAGMPAPVAGQLSYVTGVGLQLYNGSAWVDLATGSGAVSSVNGQTGVVLLGKADLGLGNVDNVSDAAKPISADQQTALDGKLSLTGGTLSGAAVFSGTGAAAHALTSDVTGDTSRRFQLRRDGTMWWGPGNAGQDTNLFRSAAYTLKAAYSFAVGENLAVGQNLTVTGAATITGVLRPGVYTTALRPTAASAGAGGMIYDSTLGRPIWSNGSVWKDAAGTTV